MPIKLDYTLSPSEFDDVILVLMNGAKKYEPKGWEKGIKFEKEANLASIKRHISDYRQDKLADEESGLHPLLHVACRALMQYTLDKRQNVTRNVVSTAQEVNHSPTAHSDFLHRWTYTAPDEHRRGNQ